MEAWLSNAWRAVFRNRRTPESDDSPRRRRARSGLSLESLETRWLLAADPLITEFVADNADGLEDGYGSNSDWIELYNAGDDAIDLAGWYLTDDLSDLTKWTFPAVPQSVLEAGQYLVVFASDEHPTQLDPAGNLHTNFRLSADGESLALVQPDGVTIQSQFESDGSDFPIQYQDVAYGIGNDLSDATLVAPNAPVNVLVPTATTDATYGNSWQGGDEAAFQSAGGLAGWSTGTTTGVGYDTNPDYGGSINTDMLDQMFNAATSVYLRIPFQLQNASQVSGLQLQMLYDDGFVAYINGQEVARQFVVGEPTWNATATTDNHEADEFEIFDLSEFTSALRDGDNILAIHGANRTANSSDFLILPVLVATVASGQTQAGYLPQPTPGGPNGASYVGLVGDTQFSRDRGLYDGPFEVVITNGTPGASLVYTTDGSEPSATNGTAVPAPDENTGPIATVLIDTTTTLRAAAIKPGFYPSNVDTQTYLFLGDVAQQVDLPAGYPTSWAGVAADYTVDPDVTGNPLYASTFVDDLKSVPIVSLVTDVANLFDPSTGIYVNSLQSGVTWERPVSVELLNFEGSDALQIDAGVRIFGGVSRQLDRTPKKSFRLQFKSIYGSPKLDFPFFEDSPVREFDRLMLRGGYNYKWTHADATQQARAQYMRDQFSRESQLALGQPASHGRYVHVFLNGLYWGMYNAVERPDESFAESYFGRDKEDYDVIKHGTPPEAIEGDRIAWDAMFATAKDPTRSPAEKYTDIQEYLDIDNLIDYMIMIHYTGNVDAPVLIGSTTSPRNFYALRPREAGGQYKFFLWDSEHSLSTTDVDRTELGVGNADDTPARLYGELRASSEFRLRFADRVHKHFFNNGALTVDASVNRYLDIAAEIDRAIVGESARWGDVRRAVPYTRDVEWLAEQNRLVTQFFPGRHNVVLAQWRADGLYPNVPAPSFSQHGGTFAESLALTMSTPLGTIYYTVDGTDPRNPNNNLPSSTAQLWTGTPLTLDQSTRVQARVMHTSGWSALTSADFVAQTPPTLRITELMYHPADDPTGVPGDWEYVEVQNIGDQPLHVNGFQLSGGVTFDFSDETLAPGEHGVIVQNATAFVDRYGSVARILGEYTGQLNNAGESLRLSGRAGETIQDFSYQDDWYPITDGDGYALVVIDPAASLTAWNDPEQWRPSERLGGSPGQADVGYLPGSIVINEVASHGTDAAGNWIELRNTTTTSMDLSGWYLSPDPEQLAHYQIPSGIVLPALGYVVLTQNAHFGPAAAGVNGFTLPASGSQLVLASPGDGTTVGGYRESVEFAGALPLQTYGRHTNSAAVTDFVPLATPSPGTANAQPWVGPVVLHEVMYNPADTRAEYIELYNASDSTVSLYDPAAPNNTWRFTRGITYEFPTGVTLGPGEYLVVANTEPSVFRQMYGVSDSVAVLGPFVGALDNAGERVTLSMPSTPLTTGQIPWIPVDQVEYGTEAPWPDRADGQGASLNRLRVSGFGSEPQNWGAGRSGGTPGGANLLLDATPPSVPSNLLARRLNAATLELTWHPSFDPQSGVQAYNVYLDDHLIGSTTTPRFEHPRSFGQGSYGYRVSAVNGDGFVSELSHPLATATLELRNGQTSGSAYDGTDDATLGAHGADSFYGDVETLVADYDTADSSRERRILLRWDLTSVGPGLGVLDANVVLQVLDAPVDRSFVLFEAKQPWVEGEVSWNEFRSGQAWQEPGASGLLDRGTVVLGTASPTGAGPLSVALNTAGIAMVEHWLNHPTDNHGFLLVDSQTMLPQAAEAPPTPPVLHWAFDGNLTNTGSGGASLNATVVGPSPVYIATDRNQGLDLQNTAGASAGGQHVRVDYALPDQGTIALWYRADPFYNFQTIFDNSVHRDDWEMWIYSDGRLRSRIDSNSGQTTADLNALGGPDNWYHIAYSWDRTDATPGAARLYVNGTLIETDDIPLWVEPGTEFFLGGGNDGNTYGTGTFDDVRIYDYVLSQDNISFLVGDSSEEPTLTTGLVSYWALDDGTLDPATRTAADSAGPNSGMLAGFDDPPSWLDASAGKVGGALHFDGGTAHVFIPNSPSLNMPSNAVTLAAWVNLELLPSQLPESFGAIYDSNEDSYVLYEDRGANELRFKVTDADGSAERPGIPASQLSLDQWHLVVGVYDGTRGQASIYLDGELVDTHTNAALTGQVLPGQIAAIGRNGASTVSAFRGDIDEVALWSRALSDDEIAALWNEGAGIGLLQISADPVIHWPLDGSLTNAGTLGPAGDGLVVDGPQGHATFVATAQGQGLDLQNSGVTGGDYAAANYTLTDRGTIALWYFVEDYNSNQTIFDNSAAADRWKLDINGEGIVRFQMADGLPELVYDLDQAGGPNQWYHLAVVWDRDNTTDAAVRLLVNGQRVAASSIDGWADPGSQFYLGGGNEGNTYGSGVWDDVRIYDQPLDLVTLHSIIDTSLVPRPMVVASSESLVVGDRPALQFTQVIPGPGDFNGDGALDCGDMQQLVLAIAAGTVPAMMDLNEDGALDGQDVLTWALDYKNTVAGDANLDYVVDAQDLGIWQLHQFSSSLAWCDGDWNGDGFVDGRDFNLWNAGRFTSVASARWQSESSLRRTPRAAAPAPPILPEAQSRDIAWAELSVPVRTSFLTGAVRLHDFNAWRSGCEMAIEAARGEDAIMPRMPTETMRIVRRVSNYQATRARRLDVVLASWSTQEMDHHLDQALDGREQSAKSSCSSAASTGLTK